MKKFISLLLCVSLLACTLSGCANDLNINGKVTTPYGLFNQDEKDPCVQYKVSVGNVILAIIFCETFAVPFIIVGWFLYEPICKKDCSQSNTK